MGSAVLVIAVIVVVIVVVLRRRNSPSRANQPESTKPEAPQLADEYEMVCSEPVTSSQYEVVTNVDGDAAHVYAKVGPDQSSQYEAIEKDADVEHVYTII